MTLLLTVSLYFAWACTPRQRHKPLVAASIAPQAFLIKQIAGDKIDVHIMVTEGHSPETFDPTPQDLISLNKSLIYFAVGDLGFENAWVPRFQDQNKLLKVVNTSKGIKRLCARHHCHQDSIHTLHADPHTWTTPANMQLMAENICQALCEADGENARFYRQNLDTLTTRLTSIHDRIRQLTTIANSRSFVIYHPALSYLAEAYHLNQIGIEQDYKEPTVSTLKELVQSIEASDAKVILMQQEFDKRLVETLAQETGLRVVRINLLNEDWETEIMRIILEITR